MMPESTDPELALSPTKQALLKLKQMQAKLDAWERTQYEPIAVVGMGCRFPGGVNHPEAFWQLIHHQRDAMTQVPTNRWNLATYYDPDPEAPGKMCTRWGGFLRQVDHFDAQFFRISPREALSLDPQHRLLLEVSWEALENAAFSPEAYAGSRTGVFIGMCSQDYWQHLLKRNPADIDAYLTTGNTHSVAAGRISYTFGFTGPSLAVDTACSSSLVAMHLAVNSLRNQECDMALVGGVNLLLSPETSINLTKARMLSPDGRCKTFDASANGFVRSEGCGVVVLKRLSEAIAATDHIRAVICGCAVNQDGRTSSLMISSTTSQQRTMADALQASRLAPSQLSYVETHGTGTVLGDCIEVEAIGNLFTPERPAEQPLCIGSVKANLGHLEAAAGIAGFIKTVLMLEQETIPPQQHFKTPNHQIPWESLSLKVPQTSIPWQRGPQPRFAGVNAFGFSGTNAHVVVAEAPQLPLATPLPEPSHYLLTLSAKTPLALQHLVSRYANYLATHPDLAIADVCFSANTGRTHFTHRLALTAISLSDLQQQLTHQVNQSLHTQERNQANVNCPPQFLFAFPDVRPQPFQLGQYLYQTQPSFQQTLDQCFVILNIDSPKRWFEQAELIEPPWTYPMHFAWEYALAQLYLAWGITPTHVSGCGVGAYVAACVANLFSLETGLQLAIAQGKIAQTRFANRIPETDSFAPTLTSNHQETHDLSSPPEHLTRIIQAIHYSYPQISVLSSQTGQEIASDDIAAPDYWLNHAQHLQTSTETFGHWYHQNSSLIIALGSSSLHSNGNNHAASDISGHPCPPLHRGPRTWSTLLSNLCHLYRNGADIHWGNVEGAYRRRKVVLPTYPFQRQRYWLDIPKADD